MPFSMQVFFRIIFKYFSIVYNHIEVAKMFINLSSINIFSRGIAIAGILLWIIISHNDKLSEQTKRVASYFCLGMFLTGFIIALHFGFVPDE